MFTGLVQSLGSINALDRDRLQISLVARHATSIVTGLEIGDSVAVDGVCLTVEAVSRQSFIASVSPETLERTTLGIRDKPNGMASRRAARYANLETSLKAGSKIGGHFVTGHIDGIGCLLESQATENAWLMRFSSPPDREDLWCDRIGRYLIAKGSIAVNGVSLTIADLSRDRSWFSCALIPHTYSETNLRYLQRGDLVNLESDILGKYVERAVRLNLGNFSNDSSSGDRPEDISLNFLTENGYI